MPDDVEPTTPPPSPDAPDTAPLEPAATPGPAVPAPMRPAMPDLSAMDPTSRMIAVGGAVAVVAAVIGGLLKSWDSTDFLLIILAGGIAAALAAWFTSTMSSRPTPPPVPFASVELAGAAVVMALGGLRLIELVFDVDAIDGLGDVTDLLLAIVLAGAGVAMMLGVTQRDPSLRRFGLDRDQGTKIAAIGTILILLGWAINLSFGYWRMTQASTVVALAVFGFIAILTAPTWVKSLPGIPVAWLGAALGVIVAILAIGHWGSLGRLGDERELGLTDYLPVVAYGIGVLALIAGGFLAGQATMADRLRSAPNAPAVAPADPTSPPPDADTAVPPSGVDPELPPRDEPPRPLA